MKCLKKAILGMIVCICCLTAISLNNEVLPFNGLKPLEECQELIQCLKNNVVFITFLLKNKIHKQNRCNHIVSYNKLHGHFFNFLCKCEPSQDGIANNMLTLDNLTTIYKVGGRS